MNAATARHLQNAIREGKIVHATTVPMQAKKNATGILGEKRTFTITIDALHFRKTAAGFTLTAHTRAGETIEITDAWIHG